METQQKESVRKQATILYADITGFDDLSEKLEPEEITKLMNKYFEVMGSVVSLYEGSVEKFSGDGITAVFGVPDFTEKTPINAVSAAVELQNKITEP